MAMWSSSLLSTFADGLSPPGYNAMGQEKKGQCGPVEQ